MKILLKPFITVTMMTLCGCLPDGYLCRIYLKGGSHQKTFSIVRKAANEFGLIEQRGIGETDLLYNTGGYFLASTKWSKLKGRNSFITLALLKGKDEILIYSASEGKETPFLGALREELTDGAVISGNKFEIKIGTYPRNFLSPL